MYNVTLSSAKFIKKKKQQQKKKKKNQMVPKLSATLYNIIIYWTLCAWNHIRYQKQKNIFMEEWTIVCFRPKFNFYFFPITAL